MALPTVVADILWNFDILGSVTMHKTLWVHGDRLGFDDRYLQGVRRTVTGDGRQQILAAIQKTLSITEEVLHSYQCNNYVGQEDLKDEQLEIATTIVDNVTHILERQTKIVDGLNTLATFERYNDDSAFKIEMNRFQERLQKICKKCELIKSRVCPILTECTGFVPDANA